MGTKLGHNTARQLFVAILRPLVEARSGIITYEELEGKTGLPRHKIQTKIHKAFSDIRRDYGIHFIVVPRVGYAVASPKDGNNTVDGIRRHVHRSAQKGASVTACVVTDPTATEDDRKHAIANQCLLGAVATASSLLAIQAAKSGLIPIANGSPALATIELINGLTK